MITWRNHMIALIINNLADQMHQKFSKIPLANVSPSAIIYSA
jgi:hypothetical protein